jgi:hypothetical protein
MRGVVLGFGLLFVSAAAAQDAGSVLDWRFLKGPEISAMLTDLRLDYGAQWQEFRASGKTLYSAGQDSWGYWKVRGDFYCSMWPPSDLWACYGMQTDGTKVRFVGDGGELTVGTFKN